MTLIRHTAAFQVFSSGEKNPVITYLCETQRDSHSDQNGPESAYKAWARNRIDSEEDSLFYLLHAELSFR